MQAAPSQAELLYKNYKIIKEKLKSYLKERIMDKYGNAATEEEIPRELLLGQSEMQVEYDRAGRVIKGLVWFIAGLLLSPLFYYFLFIFSFLSLLCLMMRQFCLCKFCLKIFI